jgi:hypothetical protein
LHQHQDKLISITQNLNFSKMSEFVPSKMFTLQMGFGFHKWLRDLRREAAAKSLSAYIGLPQFTRASPPKLSEEIRRKVDAGTANATEFKAWSDYLERHTNFEDKCAKALALINSTISPAVQQSIERHVPFPEVPSIKNIDTIMGHIRQKCGGVWSATAQVMSDRALMECPQFHTVKDFDDAMEKYRNLKLERDSWSEPTFSVNPVASPAPVRGAGGGGLGICEEEDERPATPSGNEVSGSSTSVGVRGPAVAAFGRYAWPDSHLVLWLQERVVRTDMQDVSLAIENTRIMFDQALRLVEDRFEKIREREQRATVTMVSAASGAVSQIAPQQSSIQMTAFAAQSSKAGGSSKFVKLCFNCKSPDHALASCPHPVSLSPGTASKLRCSRCRGIGHHMSQCPSPPFEGSAKLGSSGASDASVGRYGKRPSSHVYVKSGDKRVKVSREILPKVTEILDAKRAAIDAIAQACFEEDDDYIETIEFGEGLEDEVEELRASEHSS